MFRCDTCSRVFVGSPHIVITSFNAFEDDIVTGKKFNKVLNANVVTTKHVEWIEPKGQKMICPVCYAIENGKPEPTLKTYCHCFGGRFIPTDALLSKGRIDVCGGCEKRECKTNGSVVHKVVGDVPSSYALSPRDAWADELMMLEENNNVDNLFELYANMYIEKVFGYVKEKKFVTAKARAKELLEQFGRHLNGKQKASLNELLKDKDEQQKDDGTPFEFPTRSWLIAKYIPAEVVYRIAELRVFLGQSDDEFYGKVFDSMIHREEIYAHELADWKLYLDYEYPTKVPLRSKEKPVDMTIKKNRKYRRNLENKGLLRTKETKEMLREKTNEMVYKFNVEDDAIPVYRKKGIRGKKDGGSFNSVGVFGGSSKGVWITDYEDQKERRQSR